MFEIVDLFKVEHFRPKVKSRVEELKRKFPQHAHIFANTETSGLNRLQRLDLGFSLHFDSRSSVVDLESTPQGEDDYIGLASQAARTHYFAYDLFVLNKAVSILEKKGGKVYKDKLSEFLPQIVIARTSSLEGNIPAHGILTVKSATGGRFLIVGLAPTRVKDEFQPQVLEHVISTAHELSHALATEFLGLAARPLEIYQDPLLGYDEDFLTKNRDGLRKFHTTSVANVLDEAVAIFVEGRLTEDIIGRELSVVARRRNPKAYGGLKYAEATRISGEWMRQGLDLTQLPQFLGHLREELEDIDIYVASLDGIESQRSEYEQALKVILNGGA